MLEKLKMNQKLSPTQYKDVLPKLQVRLREMEFKIFKQKVPVLCVFEGWDAAGKGGAIKRVTELLDPRGFTVSSYAAPRGDEKTHHYLWRFLSVDFVTSQGNSNTLMAVAESRAKEGHDVFMLPQQWHRLRRFGSRNAVLLWLLAAYAGVKFLLLFVRSL